MRKTKKVLVETPTSPPTRFCTTDEFSLDPARVANGQLVYEIGDYDEEMNGWGCFDAEDGSPENERETEPWKWVRWIDDKWMLLNRLGAETDVPDPNYCEEILFLTQASTNPFHYIYAQT